MALVFQTLVREASLRKRDEMCSKTKALGICPQAGGELRTAKEAEKKQPGAGLGQVAWEGLAG